MRKVLLGPLLAFRSPGVGKCSKPFLTGTRRRGRPSAGAGLALGQQVATVKSPAPWTWALHLKNTCLQHARRQEIPTISRREGTVIWGDVGNPPKNQMLKKTELSGVWLLLPLQYLSGRMVTRRWCLGLRCLTGGKPDRKLHEGKAQVGPRCQRLPLLVGRGRSSRLCSSSLTDMGPSDGWL